MPCLSGQYDPNIGLLINVAILPIGVAPTPAQAPLSASQPPVLNVPQLFAALIDTGATTTCITTDVAQAVGIAPIGRREMISATHTIDTNLYVADLLLPFGNMVFTMGGIQLMEFAVQPGTPFQMLLGRDVISRGVLTTSFDHTFTFSL